jgi:uroporphyrinogen decarboxylase
MTSREIVKRTLEFNSPLRIPRHLWLLPWASDHFPHELARIQADLPDDIVYAPPFFKKPPATSGDEYGPGTFIDEWGCIFENRQKGIIGEVKVPLVKSWQDMDRVQPPLGRLSLDADQVNAFCRSTDRFVLAGCRVRPFEQLQFIRKSENLYLDLAERPKELFILLDRLHRFYLQELDLWARTEVDGLLFSDDWGGQYSLLISPALWRELFKPLYREYVEIAHRSGKAMFMHSDGYIMDIIPDLVEIGVDALNSQIFCMDIESLGRLFRGKITFWGEIDRQHILPYGTPEEVRAAVRRVWSSLYDHGGVIAQCEFGIGARPENVRLVFETWSRFPVVSPFPFA